MDDFQRLGFSSVPESSGNNVWKIITAVAVASIIIYLLAQAIQKSVNKTLAVYSASIQNPYKPIEVEPGWYAVRGFSGYYTKERLQELDLWIE